MVNEIQKDSVVRMLDSLNLAIETGQFTSEKVASPDDRECGPIDEFSSVYLALIEVVN